MPSTPPTTRIPMTTTTATAKREENVTFKFEE